MVSPSSCFTRDLPPFSLSITPDEGQACMQQIAERCADIGDPIPIGAVSSSSAIDGDPATIFDGAGTPQQNGCGIGFELAFLLPLLMSLHRRRRRGVE